MWQLTFLPSDLLLISFSFLKSFQCATNSLRLSHGFNDFKPFNLYYAHSSGNHYFSTELECGENVARHINSIVDSSTESKKSGTGFQCVGTQSFSFVPRLFISISIHSEQWACATRQIQFSLCIWTFVGRKYSEIVFLWFHCTYFNWHKRLN